MEAEERKRKPVMNAQREECRPFKIPKPHFPKGDIDVGEAWDECWRQITHRPGLVFMTVQALNPAALMEGRRQMARMYLKSRPESISNLPALHENPPFN